MTLNKHIFENIANDITENDSNIFIDELLSIYDSEKKLNSTLPTMILNAKSIKIANGLTEYLKFTQEHLLRLEIFFKSINQPFQN